MNGGGLGDSVGSFSSGSPRILRIIRNLSGSSLVIGRTLSATGLYFFVGMRFLVAGGMCDVLSMIGSGLAVVEDESDENDVKIEFKDLSDEAEAAGRFAELLKALTGASDVDVGNRGCTRSNGAE